MPLREPDENKGLSWVLPTLLTVVWFGAVGWYLSVPWTPPGGTPVIWLEKIWKLDPSQFGDFLAGAFAPVAFFWLAYSVLIQRQELADTRKVMKDQEKALQSSSASNKELADETKAQNAIERERLYIDVFNIYLENFEKFCKKYQYMAINTEKLKDFKFEVQYIELDRTKQYLSPKHIADNIYNAFSKLESEKSKLKDSSDRVRYKSFKQIIYGINEYAKKSQLNESIYFSQGFHDLYTALEKIEREINNE